MNTNIYPRSRILLLAMLLLASQLVWSANATLDWKTFESDHFLIHFPTELQHLVPEVAAESERAHSLLVPYMEWQPEKKTHVVMVDDYDSPNGSATPIPNNTMMLIMQPPISGSLTDYDTWLRLLIVHEYTHILHIDKALDLPKFFRSIFGRFLFLFPNALHPNWFQEGFATYHETDDELGIGRGQSDTFQMMMRQEVLTGLKSLGEVNTILSREWPLNHAYLYGVYYMRFIRDTYGEQALKRLINDYSDNLLPFRVDSNPRGATGKNLRRLWPEFEAYLKREFASQANRIEEQGVTQTQRLVDEGLSYGTPRVSSQNVIWFTGSDGYNGTSLYRFKQSDSERLVHLNSTGDLDISENGDLILSQFEVCKNRAVYFDLYKIPAAELYQDTPKLERLTECGRYHKVRWYGENLIALNYNAAKASLKLLDGRGQVLKTLWQGQAGDILGDFDVNDQGLLVAVIKLQKQSWNLFKAQIPTSASQASLAFESLTQDDAIQAAPKLKNGQLYYVVSANGQKEAYRQTLVPNVGKPQRLTNLLSGVEEVVPYGERQLLLTEYTSEGYRISLAFQDESLPTFTVSKSARYQDAAPVQGNTSDYSPLPSAAPTWWWPVVQSDGSTSEIGFYTMGNDAVGFHNYVAQLSYESTYGYLLPVAQYSYDNRVLFNYTAQLSDIELGLADVENSATYQRDASVAYMHSEVSFAHRINPYIAYLNSMTKVITDEGDKLKLPVNGKQIYEVQDDWVALGVIYSSLESDLYHGEYARGLVVQLNVESASLIQNDVSEGEVFTLDGRHHLSFNAGATLAQRLVLGVGDEGTPNFKLGGVFSDPFVLPTISLNKRDYALRGYEEGLAELRGDNMALYSVEYRFPFNWKDQSIMVPPVGSLGWSTRLFTEVGAVWQSGESPDKAYPSVGAELILDNTIGYYLPVRLRIGAAVGLDKVGSEVGYIQVGSTF